MEEEQHIDQQDQQMEEEQVEVVVGMENQEVEEQPKCTSILHAIQTPWTSTASPQKTENYA